MKNNLLYKLVIGKVETKNEIEEEFYPFGEFTEEKDKIWILKVRSPEENYYTDIFSSFIMNPEEASELYFKILEEQGIDEEKTKEKMEKEINDPALQIKEKFKDIYLKKLNKFLKENIIVKDI